MTAWPMCALGDVCDLEIGRTPPRADPRYWGKGHPWLSIADIRQGRDLSTTKETITDAAVRECRCRLVPSGTLVMSFKLSVGKVGIIRTPMYTNEAIAALLFREPSQIDTGYMYHALRGLDFSGSGERAVKGITLNLQSLGRLRVPVPPIDEQRRIAALLDRADGIRQKRQESLRLLDELLRSAFLQMFGDPVGNERGWELRAIAEVAKVTTGNTPPRSHPEYYGASIEWIKSDNINTAEPYLTRASEGLSPVGRRVARTAAPGAVLMTCIAGSRKCIGNVALAGREVAFNQQINAVEPSLGVDSRFLYVLFRVGKRLVQQASTDSMKGMVTKGRLEHVKVIHPPIDLQNRFGEWFNRWHTARSRQRQALESSEMLFHSIAHGAFEGAQ